MDGFLHVTLSGSEGIHTWLNVLASVYVAYPELLNKLLRLRDNITMCQQ